MPFTCVTSPDVPGTERTQRLVRVQQPLHLLHCERSRAGEGRVIGEFDCHTPVNFSDARIDHGEPFGIFRLRAGIAFGGIKTEGRIPPRVALLPFAQQILPLAYQHGHLPTSGSAARGHLRYRLCRIR